MNKKSYIPVIAVMILLAACSIGVDLDIYNNTSGVIDVSSCGKNLAIQQFAVKKIRICDDIEIVIGDSIFQYDGDSFLPVTGSYSDFDPYFRGAFRGPYILGQLNGDGAIYALPSELNPPVSTFEDQPPGYPVQGKILDDQRTM